MSDEKMRTFQVNVTFCWKDVSEKAKDEILAMIQKHVDNKIDFFSVVLGIEDFKADEYEGYLSSTDLNKAPLLAVLGNEGNGLVNTVNKQLKKAFEATKTETKCFCCNPKALSAVLDVYESLKTNPLIIDTGMRLIWNSLERKMTKQE